MTEYEIHYVYRASSWNEPFTRSFCWKFRLKCEIIVVLFIHVIKQHWQGICAGNICIALLSFFYYASYLSLDLEWLNWSKWSLKVLLKVLQYSQAIKISVWFYTSLRSLRIQMISHLQMERIYFIVRRGIFFIVFFVFGSCVSFLI